MGETWASLDIRVHSVVPLSLHGPANIFFIKHLLFHEVDETMAYYTEWSKSEREKQISYIISWWNNLQGSSGDADIENRLVDSVEGRRGWGKL